MLTPLPRTTAEFMTWPMERIQPYFDELLARPLTDANVSEWLADWSHLSSLINERQSRLYVGNTQDTSNETAEKALYDFLDNVQPAAAAAEQKLKEKLLASGLEPDGMAIPIHQLRTDAALFCDENLPLLTEHTKLGTQYNKIIGAQTVEWQGKTYTPTQLRPQYNTPDRTVREQIWRLISTRQLADRAAINENWVKLLQVRRQIAANAGFPDYRAYSWQAKYRFAYTPDDAQTFLDAIAEVVVPAASRVYARYQERLGVTAVRPWDISGDAYLLSFADEKVFSDGTELATKASAVLNQVDGTLGQRFDIMRQEHLLDLDNRQGKAPGGYCTNYAVAERPFIFMNAVGMQNDVRTILHEAGHAFHDFEMYTLPYIWQRNIGMEIAEVASMSMELLSFPYLSDKSGGFFNAAAERDYKQNQLEQILLFWPYMAVVDGFQHWAYTHPDAAADPTHCDAAWSELWDRYLPGINFTGLEDVKATGWHRKLHIHRAPFYYIEYGLAQVGAVHVWRNAMGNQQAAVQRYRQALALGVTQDLPALFAAAGAKFSFDAAAMRDVVDVIEGALERL